MDPLMDPLPPVAAEPTAHLAQPAPAPLPVPVPVLAPAPAPNTSHAPAYHHPPYSEMITAAITALNESDGSSRQAIAKYIERVYSNLPPTHSALLTHHLKRMKTTGELVMVKHSYKLPRSAPHHHPLTPNGIAAPPAPAPPPPSGPKRRPGRPSKPKVQPNDDVHLAQVDNNAPLGPESVFASVGLIDVPPTVGFAGGPSHDPGAFVGGPSNVGYHGGPVPTAAPGGFVGGPVPPAGGLVDGLPSPSSATLKRGRGRPPKLNPDGTPAVKRVPGPPAKINVVGLGGSKRRPGRPPAYVAAPGPFGAAPRSRGRPKRGAAGVAKRRGRPPKAVVAAPSAAVPGAAQWVPIADNAAVDGVQPAPQTVVPAKRRGRPPRAAGQPKRPRKLSGKPLGRPKKNAVAAAAVAQASESQHLLAYQDLRGKVEYIQSRIRQAVSTIRPCLNSESPVTAIAAFQELEELGTIDVTGPLNQQVEPAPVFQNQPQ